MPASCGKTVPAVGRSWIPTLLKGIPTGSEIDPAEHRPLQLHWRGVSQIGHSAVGEPEAGIDGDVAEGPAVGHDGGKETHQAAAVTKIHIDSAGTGDVGLTMGPVEMRIDSCWKKTCCRSGRIGSCAAVISRPHLPPAHLLGTASALIYYYGHSHYDGCPMVSAG